MAVHDIRNRQEGRAEAEHRTLRSLFRELANEISTLFRQEVALVKAETGEKVSQARNGLVSMVTGGAIAYAGLIILLMAAGFGLAEVMHPGWAFLIVGVATAIIGLIALSVGRKKLKTGNMMPHRTADSLRRDADVAARRM